MNFHSLNSCSSLYRIQSPHICSFNLPVQPWNGVGRQDFTVPVLEDAPVASWVDDLVGWVEDNRGKVWKKSEFHATEARLEKANKVVEIHAVGGNGGVHLVADDAACI